jgi:hypothetical protein
MSKLAKKVALVTGGSPGHWRSDREASGLRWSERSTCLASSDAPSGVSRSRSDCICAAAFRFYLLHERFRFPFEAAIVNQDVRPGLSKRHGRRAANSS